MKIGKIRAACKAVQKCQLLTDERARRQWIGNGYAYYPVEGMWIEADEIEMLRGRAERAEAALKAAEDDIRMLLLRGIPGYNIVSVCTFCAENGAKRENCACDGKCEEKARWRGQSEESEEEHD
jgi:hypothetical protein